MKHEKRGPFDIRNRNVCDHNAHARGVAGFSEGNPPPPSKLTAGKGEGAAHRI